METATVVQDAVRELARVDRAATTHAPALRAAGAVVLALAAGVLTGHVGAGLAVAGGAALVGWIVREPGVEVPARTLALVALGGGMASAIGLAVAGSDLGAALAAGLAGAVGGAVSVPYAVRGLLSLVLVNALLIATAVPMHVTAGAGYVALVVLGGLLVAGVEALEQARLRRAGHLPPVLPPPTQVSSDVRWRHAVRLALALAVATAIGRHLPLADHSFWLPVAVLWVLRPAVEQTTSFVVARTAGTAVGAVAATLLVAALHPPAVVVVAVAGVLAYLGYTLFDANYAACTAAFTAFTVLTLSLIGHPAWPTAGARALDTAIAGTIALVAMLGWPDGHRRVCRLRHRVRSARAARRTPVPPLCRAAEPSPVLAGTTPRPS